MQKRKNTIIDNKDLLIDFTQLWYLFKKNWKWFPISMIICTIIASVYLWYTPTTVAVMGKMELIDKSKNGSSGISAGMALLNSLPLDLGSSLRGSSLGIDAETEILLSNTLVCNVVKDLGVYTEYRLSKWGRKTLLYQNTPITVSLDSAHVQWFDEELPLTYHQIQLTVSKDSKGYKVKTRLIENKVKTTLPIQTFATLPVTIQTEVGELTFAENILPPKQAKSYEGDYTLKITISPPSRVADNFISRLTAEPPKKAIRNILNITLQEEHLIRGIDFINGLVDAYNQRANNVKNEEVRKTDEFVNARLAKIDVELGSSDDEWENSKKLYQITAPEVDAQEALTKKTQYELQLVEMESKIQLHDYLSDFISDPKNLFELIPIGLVDGASEGQATAGAIGTSSFIAQHNQLVNQRKDLLKSVSEKSSQVQRLTESIQELHPTILLAMKRDRAQLEMQKKTLDREYAKYSGRIGNAPQMERVFTEISRQREIKQAVYLLLLQKREETTMELANTTDNGRLIDNVMQVFGSNKPKKKMVLIAAFFIGVLLPMGVLYLMMILKTKIDTSEELKSFVKFPILAELSTTECDEAIRNLRTNLLLNLGLKPKTILVSSQHEGDGKSFIAKHLVDSLAIIGKKVLFVDGDLRKSEKGSHPADTLASEDFAQMMAAAKTNNDYVIIDSPSLGLYVDAYQLAQFADATLYVVKAGTTAKADVESLNRDNRLPQPMLVLNGVSVK